MAHEHAADHLVDVEGAEGCSRPALEARAKALRVIVAITDAVFGATEPHDVFTRAFDAIAQFTRFPAIALFELSDGGERLDLVHATGFDEQTLHAGARLPVDGSLTGVAVRRRQLVLSPDVSHDARTEPAAREQLAREGFSATASIPLLVDDRVLGAMNLIYKGELGLSECERGMLASIAKAIAVALDRAHYVQALERERQRAQQSEARCNTTMRSIGDAVVVTDGAGRVVFINPRAEQLTGYTCAEAVGRSADEIVRLLDETTREPAAGPATMALRRCEVVEATDAFLLVARDGAERHVSPCSAPIFDEHGKTVGAVVMCRDVTGSVREQRWRDFLHEARRQFLQVSLDYGATLVRVARLAVGSLADWCIVDMVQPDGTIAAVAGAHADAAKQPVIEALVKATRLAPEAQAGVPRALRTGQPLLRTDIAPDALLPGPQLAFGSADPEYLALLRALETHSYLIVPVRGERAFGALLFGSRDPRGFDPADLDRARDFADSCAVAVTNARLYREARDAVAVRDEFLNVASHELRTPLTALQLDLESLERIHVARGDEAAASKVRRAIQQAKRLGRLCDGLIDVSRLSTGRVALLLERVDLQQLMQTTVERYREEAARSGSVIQLDPGPPVVGQWDELRIAQVVSNLLANAVKYGAGYPIEVSVARAEGTARITIADHGIGISPKDATRIFERFERAAPSQHYGGLGLGLYVAREIVQAHGGSILVSSQPGAGATFTVVLPVRASAGDRRGADQSVAASAAPASPPAVTVK